MAIDLIEIGKRIREVRGKRTGIEFGKLLGVGNNMVSVYESGQSFPKTQTLDKIIELSGKSADWLLYGREETDADRQPTVSEQMERYSPESLTVADMFEVKVEGKTPQERLDFIREIMDTIRRKG